MRKLLLLSALFATAANAQDIGARTSPQFVRYTLGAPSNNTISEMAIPLYAVMPMTQMITFDIGTAFASAKLTNSNGGQGSSSSISGLTDTQLRAIINLGGDAVVLTGSMNLPTGQSTVKPAEQAAAGLIGNDFLVFPISSLGSGFGGTGGVAFARPMGDWSVGAGVSVRRTTAYSPYEDSTGKSLRFAPGNETRARIGFDHPFGTGRASIGFTYSKLGNDQLVTSIYNTGDRLLSQAMLSSAAGSGDYTLSAWNLFRMSGTQVDGSASSRELITDVSAAYGHPVGEGRLEPVVDVRTWMQQGFAASFQTSLSLRFEQPMGALTVAPSAGFTIGKLAADATQTSSLSGFRAALTIRTH